MSTQSNLEVNISLQVSFWRDSYPGPERERDIMQCAWRLASIVEGGKISIQTLLYHNKHISQQNTFQRCHVFVISCH